VRESYIPLKTRGKRKYQEKTGVENIGLKGRPGFEIATKSKGVLVLESKGIVNLPFKKVKKLLPIWG